MNEEEEEVSGKGKGRNMHGGKMNIIKERVKRKKKE